MRKNWTELIKPQNINLESGIDPTKQAKLIAEPLERGFGTTMGNALRRVLLSSLQGAAVSSVKISGVLDEHSSIPGVVEDVTDLILNLKGLALNVQTDENQTIKLKTSKAGSITAGMITTDQDVEIINPDHHIATLNKGGTLEMTMMVTTGSGYVRAIPASVEDKSAGIIPIDCSFNPVKQVSYRVEDARVGQQTDYDKLIMDIETNGVVTPEEAIAFAAKTLDDQLNLFINFDEEEFLPEVEDDEVPKWNTQLFRKVEDLELSVRSSNCFKNDGIMYLGDLVQKTESEMLTAPNFGRKSLNEIKEVLGEISLSLGMKLEGWPPENLENLAKQMEESIY
jgi:DNA-directed RNA polymerase subunit alpha